MAETRQGRQDVVERAAPLVPFVRRTVGGFVVPSATQAGVLYTITDLDSALVCDCLAGQNQRHCKHVSAVYAFLARERQRTQVSQRRAA